MAPIGQRSRTTRSTNSSWSPGGPEGRGYGAQPLSLQGIPLGEPLNVDAETTVSVLAGGVAANINDGGFLVSWRAAGNRVAARLVEVSDC